MENMPAAGLHLRKQTIERVVIDRVRRCDSGSNNRRSWGVRLKGSAQKAEFDARPRTAVGERGERVRTGLAEFMQEIACAAGFTH